MTMPVLVKTWQMSVNQILPNTGSAATNNQNLLLAVKNAMIGWTSGAWVVRYSCNKTVAGSAGDGVDRWSTGTDLTWANAGTAHSWIVLRQAGISATFEVLFACESTPSQNYAVTVYTSIGGFGGGTTTTRPTASDEVLVSAASGNNGQSTAIPYRLSVWQSTDGQLCRIVVCGNNTTLFFGCFDKPANAVAGWSAPYVANYNVSFNPSVISSTSSTIVTRANSALAKLLLTSEGTYNGTLAVTHNAANDFSGEWELFPLGLYGFTSSATGRCGSMVDLWYGSSGANSGDTYPLGTPNFAQFGNLVFPWDGVTAPSLT